MFKAADATIEPQIMHGGADVTAAVVSRSIGIGFSATDWRARSDRTRLGVDLGRGSRPRSASTAPRARRSWPGRTSSTSSTVTTTAISGREPSVEPLPRRRGLAGGDA